MNCSSIRFCAGIFLLSFGGVLVSAEDSKPKPPIDPSLSAAQNDMIDALAQAQLDAATQALLEFPPDRSEPFPRRLGLLLIDAVMRDPHAARRNPIQEFYKTRMDGALNEIENTRLTREDKSDAIIWKLYNHGFVIRTRFVTLGFNLTRGQSSGAPEFAVFNDVLGRIAKECDILLVSSELPDDADPYVAEQFIKLGKRVIAPEEAFKSKPFGKEIQNPRRFQGVETIFGGTPRELKIVALPGMRQGPASQIENYSYLLVTSESLCFAHGSGVVEQVGLSAGQGLLRPPADRCDVLLLRPDPSGSSRFLGALNPVLVIPSGQHELGVPPEERLSYAATYDRLRLPPNPIMPMAWGESFYYARASREQSSKEGN